MCRAGRGEREDAEQQGPAHTTTFGRPPPRGRQTVSGCAAFSARGCSRAAAWACLGRFLQRAGVRARSGEPLHSCATPDSMTRSTPSPRTPPSGCPQTRPSGAEVPFEVVEQRHARRASLYCYRPLTGAFIDERLSILGGLETYLPAVHALGATTGLDAYLESRGESVPRDPRERAEDALRLFLARVFDESTDFVLTDQRFEARLHGARARRVRGPHRVGRRRAAARASTSAPTSWTWATGSCSCAAKRLPDAPVDADVFAVLSWEAAPGDAAPIEHARVRLAAPAHRAAPLRQRRAGARRRRLGADRRRPLADGRARRDRRAPRPAGDPRRAGGRAARLLQPDRAAHATLGRAGVGAAALRARPRAPRAARGADRPPAGAARAAGARGPVERPAARAPGGALRGARGARRAGRAHGARRVARARGDRRAGAGGDRRRRARAASSAATCARCCATCCAATSTATCARSPTTCSGHAKRCRWTATSPSTSWTSPSSSGTSTGSESPVFSFRRAIDA